MKRIEGKVAIVTGAGGGIGRGIALMFAKEGASVVVNDINGENAKKVAKEIIDLGGKALAVEADVSKSDQVAAMVDQTLKTFSKIDILVNNAGWIDPSGMPFSNATEDDWDKSYEINLKSHFLTCKAVMPHMIGKKSGKIINISSTDGKTGNPKYPHYSAAKAGVISFTQALALELAPHQITANALCPGYVWTPMWEKAAKRIGEFDPSFKGMNSKEVWQAMVEKRVPMKIAPTVEDIAKAAIFFASDDSDRITGQTLNIDGGKELH